MKDQPKPIPNATRPIWELVVDDMKARDLVGRERYGTPLQAGNGRDALVDALRSVVEIAKEAHREWDSDNDHRVGKILMALAGYRPGYRADIDAIHAAIAGPSVKSGS